jgi:uncharacterized membrane protein YkvA (DUF1232 family)
MFDVVRHLPRLLRLLRGLFRDPRVARHHKVLLVAGLAWILSPIDLLPDFLPIVGGLDDVAVALLVSRYVLRRIPEEVIADHWGGDLSTLHRLLERRR